MFLEPVSDEEFDLLIAESMERQARPAKMLNGLYDTRHVSESEIADNGWSVSVFQFKFDQEYTCCTEDHPCGPDLYYRFSVSDPYLRSLSCPA